MNQPFLQDYALIGDTLTVPMERLQGLNHSLRGYFQTQGMHVASPCQLAHRMNKAALS